MASYHLSAQIIKRSSGRSAVAAAAYRSGSRLKDARTGEVFDYSRRRGVAHAEVMGPRDAPAWMFDREKLWSSVERGEKRVDAQLAREINVALPHELTDEQRVELVRGFVEEQFVSRGMMADVAVHEPVREHGDDPRNHHAHIMLSLRKATRDGFSRTKTREWNSDQLLKDWRAAWATSQNRALGRGGLSARVDHRSLKAQKISAEQAKDWAKAAELDRAPEIHIGPRAMAAHRRGYRPKSADRPAGPIRNRARMRPGEWSYKIYRGYVDEGAGEPNWLRRQLAERKTVERREFNDRARRIVRYTVIDHGTRFEENMRRLERNTERMRERIENLRFKAARFRLRRRWLTQQEYEQQQRAKQLNWEREQEAKRRAWHKKKDSEELWRAVFARGKHVTRRRKLADGLIGQIDALVTGLLGVREYQLGRMRLSLERSRVVQKVRQNQQARQRQRRRANPSKAPPSGFL